MGGGWEAAGGAAGGVVVGRVLQRESAQRVVHLLLAQPARGRQR